MHSQTPRRLSLKTQQIDAQVFCGLVGDSVDEEKPSVAANMVDISALHAAFENLQPLRQKSKSVCEVNRVEILPRNMAQNLAIIFANLRIDTVKLATALLHLNPAWCEISADESGRLLEVWPKSEYLQPVIDCG